MTFRNILFSEKNNQKLKSKVVDLFLYNYLKSLTLWKERLSNPEIFEDYKELEKSHLNTTEYSGRLIGGVLSPLSLSDVREIIAIANELKSSLHPFSTGKNWGFGSKLPIKSTKTILVNLEKMNKIIEVNERFKYCIIQPGVTQNQLTNYLNTNYPNLMFPPTISSGDTSIVGNILERGVGIFGSRNSYLLGLEIITGNNQKIRTGFWNFKNKNTNCPKAFYKPGMGPDLNGVFTQSNFGIVTSMIISLEQAKPKTIFTVDFNGNDLNKIIEILYTLKESEIIKKGIFIGKDLESLTNNSSIKIHNKWLATSILTGNQEMAKILKKEVIKAFDKIPCHLQFNSSNKVNNQKESGWTRALKSVYNGEPTDEFLALISNFGNGLFNHGENIDENRNLIGINAAHFAIPFSGNHVEDALRELNKITDKLNIQSQFNFLGLTETSLEGQFRALFNRQNPKEVQRAQLWNKLVHQKLFELGYYPTRTNIEEMENIFPVNSEYWATVKRIKNALDPNNIISPGKYSPYA